MRKIAVAVIAFLAAASTHACKRPRGPGPEIRYSGTVSGCARGDARRLLLGDTELGLVQNSGSFKFRLPRETPLSARLSELRLECETTCGPRSVGLRSEEPNPMGPLAEQERRAVVSVDFAATDSGLRFPSVWYDNRDGEAATLTIGARSLSLPANSAAGPLQITAATCDGSDIVRLGSEDIGRLDPEADAYLLDPSGMRCYLPKTVKYAPDGMWFGGGGQGGLLYDAKLYKLSAPVDYFLTEAPQRLVVPADRVDSWSRFQILAVTCGPRR